MTAFLGISFFDLLCWLILLPGVCYLGWRGYINSENRGGLIAKWISSVVLLLAMNYFSDMGGAPLFIAPFAIVLGLIWAPQVGAFIIRPLTSMFDGGSEEVEAKPYYFSSEAKRRKGLFKEAIVEARKQLEKFPGNVEGLMKIAGIQADDMHDVSAAQATIAELLQQPELAPNAAVAALHALADWQFHIGHDAAGARATLERVVQLFPGTAFAHNARQRIAHLAGADETRKARENAVFKVPDRERNLGLRIGPTEEAAGESAESADIRQADDLVHQLELHPNDTDCRERLALLYAERLGRADLAADQLEQLTGFPNETAARIAHWLELLATVHVVYGRDLESAVDALRRIIERFPNTALASQASNRMATIRGELRTGEPAVFKRLGADERNVGVKARLKTQS